MDIITKLLTLPVERMMYILHNHCALSIDDHIVRIMELEYYHWDDPYTHCNEKQREVGTIYIHRTGKTSSCKYKGGSYKGMDITCNGGILIRSILIPGSTGVVEGPCRSVDALSNITGKGLDELENQVRLIMCNWDQKYTPYVGARVGLTLKRAGEDILRWMPHMVAPLRSAIYIPKKRETFFCTNIDRDDMKRLLRYQIEYEQGKYMRPTSSMTPLQVSGYLSIHK